MSDQITNLPSDPSVLIQAFNDRDARDNADSSGATGPRESVTVNNVEDLRKTVEGFMRQGLYLAYYAGGYRVNKQKAEEHLQGIKAGPLSG